jgi:hypothetical protein
VPSQLVRRCEDARAGVRRNTGPAVESEGDEALADAGGAGHIVDGRLHRHFVISFENA